MTTIYHTDFMLMNEWGKRLYHSVAAVLPIIDPHNHIDAAALAANKKFDNLYQLWVQHDPYKHRAMRIYGVAENLITGTADDYEKFLAWASCCPHTVGNPLFYWSCMELEILFGIDEILTTETAEQIWDAANNLLATEGYGTLDIVKRLGVEMLCTSDDLLDTLEHHLAIAQTNPEIACLPSLRGDSIINFILPAFQAYHKKLSSITGTEINSLNNYKSAITQRLNYFNEAGCLLSDHSLDSGFIYTICDALKAEDLFQKMLSKTNLTEAENIDLQSHLLHFLGTEYAASNWKMQLHIGAYRYTSSVLRTKVGPAGGYACIGQPVHVPSLCLFLDELDKKSALPKTILYTLNPADSAVFASLTGSYSQDGVQGKIQFGPAWWYNDHEEGILQQLQALSSYGLLSTSIGMTTDSRSIVSFVRHEYYRRILCNLLGNWVHQGKLPDDEVYLNTLVKNISYQNIKNWIKK